jgi:hypothetical protein
MRLNKYGRALEGGISGQGKRTSFNRHDQALDGVGMIPFSFADFLTTGKRYHKR